MKKITLLVFAVFISFSSFSQELSYQDFFINSVDSLINKQLEYQKQYRNSETLVFLLDSSIIADYDDLIMPCENQPIITYYSYNENGLVTELESKDTPEEGCTPYNYKTLFSYEDYNLTERLFKIYNFEIDEWEISSKTQFQYDQNNNVIEEFSLIWNMDLNIWENNSKTVYQYDNNNEIESNRYNWDSDINDWFWNLSETNSFDSNNNLLEYNYKAWYYVSNEWDTLRKTTHSYDTNGNVLEFVDYRKYQTEEIYEWNNIFKSVYSYDNNNFLIEELYYSSWNNELESWEAKFKYSFTNDNMGNPIEKHTLKWNFDIENWKNLSLNNYYYNANFNLIENLTKKWNIDLLIWEDFNKILYTYSQSYILLEREEQIYNVNDDYWYTNSKRTYEYDVHQNLVHDFGFGDLWGWDYLYYYSEYDITLNTYENEFQNSISIIPNPTNDLFTIDGLDNSAQLLIYDIGGKLVLDIASSSKIDISTFQKGIYFVKIISGDNVAVKKLIKN